MMENKEPIYTAQATKIIEMMKFQTRNEVAEKLNYKTWKSLDMYMRRKNFIYDSSQEQYVPVETRKKKEKEYNLRSAPDKVRKVIEAFAKENPDPKEIAKQEGFSNHKEMAEYMKVKGFEWNVYRNNYIKITGFKENGIDIELQERDDETIEESSVAEFIPFIKFLYDKREKVYQIIDGVREDGMIPKYAIPGHSRSKAVYMSDKLANAVGDFSKEKNVTQREIMETALVEYLQKYGFKQEVEALLQNRSW